MVSSADVFIEGNTVSNNGTAPGACYSPDWGGESPSHCHGVYISNYGCRGASNVTIRGNRIQNHGGLGIQWNGSGCSNKIENTLVENNIIEDNSWGMGLYYNVEGSVVRNNTLVIESYPETNHTTHNFIIIWGSSGNEFKNNIFHSTREDVYALQVLDSQSTQNSFDFNLWNVRGKWLVWENNWISDFQNKFQDVTGWGQSSWCCSVDPEFVSTSNKDYKIKSTSPAVDTGASSSCAAIDFEKQARIQGQDCDIGMDEVL